jgi:hypothetical protein
VALPLSYPSICDWLISFIIGFVLPFGCRKRHQRARGNIQLNVSFTCRRKKEGRKKRRGRKERKKPPLNPMLQNLVVVKDATTQENK